MKSTVALLPVALIFEPLRSALVRSASVKSMVASPPPHPQGLLGFMAVIHEPVRSALMRSASVKSMVPLWPKAVIFESLRSALVRSASVKSMAASL